MVGIIVFVKNPRLGYVKTRLAKDVGDKKALDIYLQLMAHTRNVLAQAQGVKRYVFYSESIVEDDEWSDDVFIKRLQSNGDLGERMHHAMVHAFLDCTKVLIVGSDCPQLSPFHIVNAISALQENDIVIGPSLDGGYYLLGMNDFYPFLFENIEWSTDAVYSQTKNKAIVHHKTIASIEPLSDVDYVKDWDLYGFHDN